MQYKLIFITVSFNLIKVIWNKIMFFFFFIVVWMQFSDIILNKYVCGLPGQCIVICWGWSSKPQTPPLIHYKKWILATRLVGKKKMFVVSLSMLIFWRNQLLYFSLFKNFLQILVSKFYVTNFSFSFSQKFTLHISSDIFLWRVIEKP